jgi:hypothetical protein
MEDRRRHRNALGGRRLRHVRKGLNCDTTLIHEAILISGPGTAIM